MSIYTGAYRGARSCTSGPQPGTSGAMDYYLSAYRAKGGVSDGIYNCRPVRGGRVTSLHGEGRAADFGVRPYGAGYGTALARAIVAHSAELGVQCVIWNHRIWSSAHAHAGWRQYKGLDPHDGHLHVELTWAMAERPRSEVSALWARILGGAKPPAPPKASGKAPAFPLGKGQYFGPKSGPDASVSGYYSHREDLRTWQRQMSARGWTLEADGHYGPQTEHVARAFQAEKHMKVTGLIGPGTWAAAWTEKVT